MIFIIYDRNANFLCKILEQQVFCSVYNMFLHRKCILVFLFHRKYEEDSAMRHIISFTVSQIFIAIVSVAVS